MRCLLVLGVVRLEFQGVVPELLSLGAARRARLGLEMRGADLNLDLGHLFPLFYGRAGKSYHVIASKGGASDHPGWYKNLLADPEAEIQVGTEHLKAKARTASGTERQKLWDDALKF